MRPSGTYRHRPYRALDSVSLDLPNPHNLMYRSNARPILPSSAQHLDSREAIHPLSCLLSSSKKVIQETHIMEPNLAATSFSDGNHTAVKDIHLPRFMRQISGCSQEMHSEMVPRMLLNRIRVSLGSQDHLDMEFASYLPLDMLE